jgi:hypothetical protein
MAGHSLKMPANHTVKLGAGFKGLQLHYIYYCTDIKNFPFDVFLRYLVNGSAHIILPDFL